MNRSTRSFASASRRQQRNPLVVSQVVSPVMARTYRFANQLSRIRLSGQLITLMPFK